jgi:hypothetical protein
MGEMGEMGEMGGMGRWGGWGDGGDETMLPCPRCLYFPPCSQSSVPLPTRATAEQFGELLLFAPRLSPSLLQTSARRN